MGSADLFLARDIFYSALFCLGLSAGCALHLFRAGLDIKGRNRKITWAILWISCSVILLTLAIIFSNGGVLFHRGFVTAGAVIFCLGILGSRFPLAAGVPVIIIAGTVVVMFSFLFLRFPRADISDASVISLRFDESVQGTVKILESQPKSNLEQFASFKLLNQEDPLRIEIYQFYFDDVLPLAGGQVRAVPDAIYQNNINIFSNPMTAHIPFINLLKDENRTSPVRIKEISRYFFLDTGM